ncbi:hypothetical protein KFK09_018861 [Dendrobium nobile]|uniref:Uncharacterized protein n=1 Tax=Dendrobium nobile TaxID=94219 RepID=A0A8T3B2C7_DENNO|nr:hypothetical protein KFK09_018861 [Dendrobium nobile]
MGRGRAPCCEKVGLNRGAWTPEEDMRLMAYIRKFGHGNWRALPKQAGHYPLLSLSPLNFYSVPASEERTVRYPLGTERRAALGTERGLLRCGKSCRLRWINYLRPDIKRGNFSIEEEETIIKLHGLLGNKWSKIASSLPGRTDNEIKNVWNTHLKKRLKSNEQSSSSPTPTIVSTANADQDTPASSSSSETTSVSIPSNLDFDDFNDSIDEILAIDIEPEVWNDVIVTEEADAGEKRNWLAYLEEELGLFDDNGGGDDENKMVEMVVVGEGDPVTSYFHKSY